jgi:hypothetical protein
MVIVVELLPILHSSYFLLVLLLSIVVIVIVRCQLNEIIPAFNVTVSCANIPALNVTVSCAQVIRELR